MRTGLFGTTLVLAAAVAAMSVGCGAADDAALEKNPERVASSSAALAPPRADCNSGQFVTTTVVAQNMAPGDPNPVYRRSLSDLLADLSACGTTKCAEQARYTSAIYSQVYGAAGYYYRVADVNANGASMFWLAIPVLDSTTTSPGYYQSYPQRDAIHTPANAAPIFPYPQSNSTSASPFWLRDNDHTNLWYVRDGSLNTVNVQGRIRAQQCIAIVDPAGNFLDYSAELEEHDPNGCSSCKF